MGQHQRCDIAIVFHKLCFFYPLIELFFRMSYLDVVPPYVYFSAPGRLLSFFDDDPLVVFNSCECIGPVELFALQIDDEVSLFQRFTKGLNLAALNGNVDKLALVPYFDGSCAVLSFRDRTWKRSICNGMILGPDREPLVLRVV